MGISDETKKNKIQDNISSENATINNKWYRITN